MKTPELVEHFFRHEYGKLVAYQWAAVLADLHRRCGNTETAERYRDAAVESAPTAAVKELLERRLMSRAPADRPSAGLLAGAGDQQGRGS